MIWTKINGRGYPLAVKSLTLIRNATVRKIGSAHEYSGRGLFFERQHPAPRSLASARSQPSTHPTLMLASFRSTPIPPRCVSAPKLLDALRPKQEQRAPGGYFLFSVIG